LERCPCTGCLFSLGGWRRSSGLAWEFSIDVYEFVSFVAAKCDGWHAYFSDLINPSWRPREQFILDRADEIERSSPFLTEAIEGVDPWLLRRAMRHAGVPMSELGMGSLTLPQKRRRLRGIYTDKEIRKDLRTRVRELALKKAKVRRAVLQSCFDYADMTDRVRVDMEKSTVFLHDKHGDVFARYDRQLGEGQLQQAVSLPLGALTASVGLAVGEPYGTYGIILGLVLALFLFVRGLRRRQGASRELLSCMALDMAPVKKDDYADLRLIRWQRESEFETARSRPGGTVKKSDREIMEIFEAFDRTGSAHSAAQLAGVDPKTVRRLVAARDAGAAVTGPARRERIIDPFQPKIEELVDESQGLIRADKVHERLVVLGFGGDERTTRRAVHEAKVRWRAGHRRTYRPWIAEPGLWLQFDWGWGPKVPDPAGSAGPDGAMRQTLLFCAWLAWSRFRVVLPTWDRTLPTLVACLDSTLRTLGGAPAFVLTDNEKTVTVEHFAGVAVRHPDIVRTGRHYGLTVHTCVPFDPESKGGAEATVRIAKADLVPTAANLRGQYGSFAELAAACNAFCENVNGRVHRESARIPAAALDVERTRLHPLPTRPHTLALGTTRTVNTDQTISFGSVRYSTPPGLVGAEVWVRADGEELVAVADLNAPPLRLNRPAWAEQSGAAGLVEVARHQLSTPGRPRIDLGHYPDHPQTPGGGPRVPQPKASTPGEKAFLALGTGAHAWLVEAAAAGAQRVRSKMREAVELAALVGAEAVDAALGVAAAAGRFAEADLLAIVEHRAAGAAGAELAALVHADETHCAQPGTSPWAGFTTTPTQLSTELSTEADEEAHP
jgi:hypothetical protein